MTLLFQRGELRLWLEDVRRSGIEAVESLSEDELLDRSTDDLVADFVDRVTVEPLDVMSDEYVDGSVTQTEIDNRNDLFQRSTKIRATRVRASYAFSGNPSLFRYRPSRYQLIAHEAEVGDGVITVEVVRAGTDLDSEVMKGALQSVIEGVRVMASFAAADAIAHNQALPELLRSAIDDRKQRVMRRRDLAGALGFPLQKRGDAPAPVPLRRKRLGVGRRTRFDSVTPYRDEPALTQTQYQEAIDVVQSTLLAMERTPSVASGKAEEDLRDQILVQLNGTFAGGATGETFVQSGKTDILIRVDDRHVFVAECKWWSGPKGCGQAIDQLLSYLPWRDEKAALVLFIDRKNASAVIAAADEAIRGHAAFKRPGSPSPDEMKRRDYILGHPDDLAREIHTAALFAVIPKE